MAFHPNGDRADCALEIQCGYTTSEYANDMLWVQNRFSMKSTLAQLATTSIKTLLCAALLCAAAAANAVKVGELAPSVRLNTAKGEVPLASLKGRVVYVDFWASWCAPCKASFPWMNTMATRFQDKGLEIVAINVDTARPAAERFLAQVPAKFTIAFEPTGTVAKQFAVTAMPMSYLLDAEGRVIYIHSGFKPADTAELERAIERALANLKRS
ncbi:MAG: TlpA family protein disulfide reductase [Burkholderiales bacterium]|nr:MAG: TlpA family protein disulfide reductase [Betaproteobacteria bacterium]TAG24843.1 MAG: TlpA family protein disulfide reductase [Burkholderiales bacterium]